MKPIRAYVYKGFTIRPKWTPDVREVRYYVIADHHGQYVAMAPDEATAKQVVDQNT